MPFLEKYCSCVPLRGMCLAIGYTMMVHPLCNLIWVIIYNKDICSDLVRLWTCADLVNLFSCVLLLVGIYGEKSSILPVHIVIKLTGLILEMISHLLIAAVELTHPITLASSYFSIGSTYMDVLIVFSYYQQGDDY